MTAPSGSTTTQTRTETSSMATATPPMTESIGAGLSAPQPSPAPDRATIKLGAVSGGTGVVLQLLLQHLHPHQEQPNRSVAAFTEYGHAHAWTAIHIGQFFGTLLIAFSMLVLCRALARQPGGAGTLARASAVAIVVVASVFAVQMAVDGVALKHAVDTWAAATGSAKTSAFQVAEGLRWLEKGLSGLFNLLNGTAVLALGLSLIVGRTYRSWPGWVAIIASMGFLAGGAVTAEDGFTPRAGTFLQPALLLLIVFLTATYVTTWHNPQPPRDET